MKILYTTLCVVLAAGCNSSSNTQSQQTVEQEQAIAIGKPAANPVTMTHQLSAERAKVGEPFEVSINFPAQYDQVSVRFQPSPHLQLIGEQQSTLTSKTGQGASQTLVVIPQTEGIHYLNVFAKEVSMAHDKPIAIRIVAGDKPLKAYMKVNGELSEDEKGRKIIIMQDKKGNDG